MTQCPICGQELSEASSRCESCDRWAADVVTPPADAPLADAALPVPVPTASASATPPKRQLAWVLIIIVASAAVTLAALMTRTESPSTVAAGASPRAPHGSAAAATPAPSPTPTQRWNSGNRERWLADAAGSVAFELAAENTVPVWMRSVRPTLVVRCAYGKMEAFVFTDSALAIEPQTEDHTVTFAIDDAAGRTERWADSQDHDALFAPDGKLFAQHLAHARTLRVGYTPHNAAPVTAHFAVAGLNELMTSAAKPCGWKK